MLEALCFNGLTLVEQGGLHNIGAIGRKYIATIPNNVHVADAIQTVGAAVHVEEIP